ncbi:hypothetical protein N7G274_003386 [Stereocaulon virgatum]|uniref:P-type ATPase A domain-containing protein n=1 Tax=Stereocaulon virgatum TaxID=373712 RepID=A0ABR4AGA4_9LECA
MVKLRVDGMICNHCPTRIVDAIKANYSDQVNLEHAPTIKDPVIKIKYLPNPPNFTIRSIIATIDALEEPFSTNIHTPPSIEQRSQQTQQHEQQQLLKRLVGTFIVAIPTLRIGVIWMSLVPSSSDVRRFFEQPVWAGTVTRTNWALFILATPIFFPAADVFHLRAIKEIRVLWRRGRMLGNLRPLEAVLVASSTLPSASPLPMDGMSESGESGEHKTPRSNTQRISASLLEVGDVVIVSHGSSPPADGIIVEGSTNFNESSLTGESRAVPKTQGETVFAGAINIGNPILVRVTELGGTSMLDQIVAVVREGQTKRAPVERVVEFLVRYFVPVITALAFAIAVFVVACPCSIALAAPTALFVGGGLAASHGILVRGGGEAFQEASIIDALVFDKTGTLTEGGNFKVTDHEILAQDEEVGVAWSITKSLEESSSHPLARALFELATRKSPHQIITVSITEEPGLGLRGTFTANSSSPDTATYEAALDSEALIASLNPTPDQLTYFTDSTLASWKSQSKSVALLAIRKVTPSATANPWTLAATFAISDPMRPTALPAISALQKIGIPVYMLTGDNPITAAAVASTLSIPSDHVFAGVLPTEKASKIQWLQKHGPKRPSSTSWFRSTNSAAKRAIVAFVGDGINDATALTTSDVSISLSSASDIAMHSSSFILLSSSLTSVLTLFQLSERVFRRVKFNFGWAVIYNVILIPVAAGCFFRVSKDGWRLGPVWGSAAMALSSLTVVLSSWALRWEGKRAKEKDAGERR